MSEPGLDIHEWQSRWASIEDDVADDPDAALSQLADLVQSVLRERGYAIDDPVASRGDEAEIVASYRSAREAAERAELGEASRTEVTDALDELRAIFDSLASELDLSAEGTGSRPR